MSLRIPLDIAKLKAALAKDPAELTPADERVLIHGVMFLSEEQRALYPDLFFRDRLTQDDVHLLESISPAHVEGQTFVDRFFPRREN